MLHWSFLTEGAFHTSNSKIQCRFSPQRWETKSSWETPIPISYFLHKMFHAQLGIVLPSGSDLAQVESQNFGLGPVVHKILSVWERFNVWVQVQFSILCTCRFKPVTTMLFLIPSTRPCSTSKHSTGIKKSSLHQPWMLATDTITCGKITDISTVYDTDVDHDLIKGLSNGPSAADR